MVTKMYLIAICALFMSIESKTINIVPSYPYIFDLELKFNEERLNDYLIDSFFATNREEDNKLLHCDVKLSDILRAIPYKKLAVPDFTAAVNELGLALTTDDIGNLISNLDYKELNTMGFTMARLQKTITKTYFKNKPADLLECLNILGIAEEFSMAVAFGTDEDLFKALQSANFSQDNLVKIRNIINTPTTLKDILNILGVKKYNPIYLDNFVNNKITPLLFDKGLTEENMKQFLTALNVSVGNYKSSKTFKSCYSTITSGNSLAVAISEDEIITNDDSVILKYLNLEKYATLTAKNIQSDGISYTILADNIDGNRTDNIIKIKINTILPNFIKETNTYSDITNNFCQYISLTDEELEIQNIAANLVNDQLVISKLYNTYFKKGSPLICGQKLYGLASIDKISAIVFDTFEESLNEEISSIPEHYKPEIINIIKEFFDDLKVNFDPCKYNLCGSSNNEQEGTSASNDESVTSATENSENVENNNNASTGDIPENDESNSDVTVSANDNNENENIDENNNLEQNEQENETTQNSETNNEGETLVTDDQTELNEQNDISINPDTNNDQEEGNVEDQNNNQDSTSSQEVSGNDGNTVNPGQNTVEPGESQSNVNDSNQNPEEEDGNQTNVEDSNPTSQETDDNQDTQEANNNKANDNQQIIIDVSQETHETDDNQANDNQEIVIDIHQETQETGDNQEIVIDINQDTEDTDGNQAIDSQEIVVDIDQGVQQIDDNQVTNNQENANEQETQEVDDNQANNNQENVINVDQEPQAAEENQETSINVNQEIREGSDDESGSEQNNQNINEQEQNNGEAEGNANIVESNPAILEGRAA